MINISEMSVLIADDMENMFTSIRSIMRLLKFGRKFVYAKNGEEALKNLTEGAFDLVMLDNNMPGMTGLEVLHLIRQDSRMCNMPVIMITAHAEKEFITNAAESEIDAYILKPITVGLLKEKIPQVIERANNPSPMFSCLKNAEQLMEQGDLDGAIREAERALEANPKSSRPLREIGYYYLKKGEIDQAEEYLLKAARKNPVDVIAFTHLGDLYLMQDRLDSALKYFSKAMEISPRHYDRALRLGKLLIRKKMADKAIPVFNKVFELAKEPVKVKEEIIDLCLAEGAHNYATKLLRGLVDQDAGRGDLLFKLALLYEEAGAIEDAILFFARAEQADDGSIDIKLHLAKNYLAQGMVIRAERPLKAILKINPEHQETRALLRKCV